MGEADKPLNNFKTQAPKMSNVSRPISETKHLENGSSYPEATPGLMRLYSMRFCPFAQRTRLVLAAKKIPNEVVNINLRSKPDWYFERNPLGKVPCLEFDGKVIYESLITADYLDEAYGTSDSLNSQVYGGDKPGMLDFMIWPWMERLPAFPIITKGLISNPCEKFPKLTEWWADMEKDEAVQESFLAPEIHAKFVHGYFMGSPDYDMDISKP